MQIQQDLIDENGRLQNKPPSKMCLSLGMMGHYFAVRKYSNSLDSETISKRENPKNSLKEVNNFLKGGN